MNRGYEYKDSITIISSGLKFGPENTNLKQSSWDFSSAKKHIPKKQQECKI